jgi:phosphoribosylamine--glycine ligase
MTPRKTKKTARSRPSFLLLGVGSFAHSLGRSLADSGASVATYLTRNYGHFSPTLVGPVFSPEAFPSPVPLVKQLGADVVIPQSIDWAMQPWAEELLESGAGIFCPTGEAMRIERERDFARQLCAENKIAFPEAHVASNRLEAEKILARHPLPFVIKNPLCSPTSPIHTILCETVEDTRAWLKQVDYAEGVFLPEYLGRAEAGHIVLISGGEIYSLVTNQEYKYAFHGNMGIVAGAPLGGLIERDPDDKYGLARQLIHPLLPWFRSVKYNGPLQVTAVRRGGRWHVVEYNIRLGVTSGPMILRALKNPAEILCRVARNQKLSLEFAGGVNFGVSITLAGYGYPFHQARAPHLPITVDGEFDCDVWWNEAARRDDGQIMATGQRIADLTAFAPTLQAALDNAYANIRKIHVLASYYRSDIGQSLWPPGNS